MPAPLPLSANSLAIGVTQSVETAHILVAMEQERWRAESDPVFAPLLLGITNRPKSFLCRLVAQTF